MTPSRSGVTSVRHVGIVVKDLERSLRFYRDLLGLAVESTLDESGAYLDRLLSLENTRVTTVKLSADGSVTLIELLQFASPRDGAAAKREIDSIGPSHVAFSVGDVEEMYRRLSRAGVRFNAPPQRSPDGRVKVSCCRDPDGTTVELVEMLRGA